MRIALIADIHANLCALEAVLYAVDKAAPDLIVSLGDQVGMGPRPAQVRQVLKSRGIACLRGNHEDRVISLRARTNQAYEKQFNFAFARWTRDQLAGDPLDDPLQRRLDTPAGFLLLLHAAPGDPYFPIAPDQPGPYLEAFSGVQADAVVAGHYHDAACFLKNRMPVWVVGAAGMAENRTPGTAQYALLDCTPAGFVWMPCTVAYDPGPLCEQFREAGLAQLDPVMARLVHEAMITNEKERVPTFVAAALSRAAAAGEQSLTEAVWQETARTFAWQDESLTCEAYWGL